jgi:hypothetical protein
MKEARKIQLLERTHSRLGEATKPRSVGMTEAEFTNLANGRLIKCYFGKEDPEWDE